MMQQEVRTAEGLDLLVIEDDPMVCQTIRTAWPVPTDRLRFVSTYKQSLGLIHSPELGFFDGVIVDIHLPDGDGMTILRTIRSNTNVPIVLISGSGTADSRADAIGLGADDYVMKPFSVRELQARVTRLVNVRLEKTEQTGRRKFRLGEMVCDLQARTLSYEDEKLALTDTETRLLDLLFRNSNRICSKSYLYKNALFREHDPSDKTLDVYLSRIRNKVKQLDEQSVEWIQTVRGSGYRIAELW
ncbi:MAG: response regulator transcription factor [Nitratireductor sp.]|nr:response regulator transcription factor [Nitratireductor sp.]